MIEQRLREGDSGTAHASIGGLYGRVSEMFPGSFAHSAGRVKTGRKNFTWSLEATMTPRSSTALRVTR
jgi:hypothetical protein